MTSLVKKLTIFITTFIFLLFGLFFTVHANQALAHTLSGNVSDSSGVDISGATVDVIDISTSNNVGSTITDGSGNYNLSVNSGTYNVQVSPPSGRGFGPAVASNYTISSDTIINFILVPTGSVVLSGHVYGPLGNPIPNQLVYLHSTVTHTDVASIRTDNSGAYLLSASPGTYILKIQGSGNDPSLLNVPSDYNLEVPNYSLTQSVVADIYVPTKQVTVHVQDSSNNPIDNVQVSTSNAGINGISIGNGLDNANARSRGSGQTDSSGNTTLWLVPSSSIDPYIFTATPPSGTNFTTTTIPNIIITNDTQETITLQSSVVLSGHVYGPLGNPIPNQLVYLHSTVTDTDVASIRTDNSGAYLLSASPGTYILNIQGSGNDPSLLNVPSDYNLEVPNYSLTQSVVADIYVPTKQVTVHVQDSSNNPIDNVQVSTSNAGINGISIGNGLDNANARSRGSGQTDSSGNTTLWLVPSSSIDPYIFTATPPSGTNFTTTTIPNIIITNDTQETITLQSSVVLSGHVYGPLGNPIPNQLVYLHSTVTHTDVASIRTDNSGAYLLSASPGTYILNIQGSGNAPSLLNVPSDYNLEVPNYSLTQSVVADIYVPTKQVTVHVQDSSNNPIDNVQVSTSNAGINGISIGNGLDNANARSRGSGQTDSSGNTTLWLVPSSSIDPYIFTATPPNGSIYLSFVLSNILVSSDQTEIISLQLIHDAPVTTATLSPNPNPQNEY